MSDNIKRLFASDKEVFDVLESSKRRMTKNQLLELLRDRRIFISPEAEREDIVDYLSSLPHDLHDVRGIIEKVGPIKRAEKTTFLEFEGDVSSIEISDVLAEYKRENEHTELVTIHLARAHAISANIKYEEFDYSQTTLLQRIPKSADIEFRVDNGKVTVRMPATDKGVAFAEAIIDRLEQKKKARFETKAVSVERLSPGDRTKFFISLMNRVPGYRVEMVSSIRVSAATGASTKDEEDEDDNKDVQEQFLGFVRSVALSGEDLLSTAQYNQLINSGFFITSMTWRAIQEKPPHDKVQFEAGFENQEEGTGFRYLFRYSQLNSQGEYPTAFKVVPEPRRKDLCQLLEDAARTSMEAFSAK